MIQGPFVSRSPSVRLVLLRSIQHRLTFQLLLWVFLQFGYFFQGCVEKWHILFICVLDIDPYMNSYGVPVQSKTLFASESLFGQRFRRRPSVRLSTYFLLLAPETSRQALRVPGQVSGSSNQASGAQTHFGRIGTCRDIKLLEKTIE